jgi:hypothetical protein
VKRQPDWMNKKLINPPNSRFISSDDFVQFKQQLANFLSFLGLDSDQFPKGLIAVCEMYCKAVEDSAPNFKGMPEELKSHLPIIQHILQIEVKQWLTEIDNDFRRSRENTATFLHGYLSKGSAPYAALYYISPDNRIALLRFQQCMLTVLYAFRYEDNDIKENHIIGFCRAIRRLCHPSYSEWMTEIDLQHLDSAAGLLSCIENNKEKKSKSGLEDIYSDCHIALDILLGHSVSLKTGGGGGGGRNQWRRYGFSAFDWGNYTEPVVYGDDSDGAEPPDMYSLKSVVYDDESELFGLEPSEDIPAFEFIFHPDQGLSPTAQAFKNKLKAQGAVKRIERENLTLILATKRLSQPDIESLHLLISDLYNNKNKLLALALLTSWLTGSDIKRVKSLVIFPKDSPLVLKGDLGFSIKENSWVLKAYTPLFATTIDKEQLKYSRDNGDHTMLLPEPEDSLASKILNEYTNNEEFRPFSGKRSYQVAKNNVVINPKKGSLETVLSSLLNQRNDRLTLARVQRCLPLYVADVEEATIATYLFNFYIPTSSARSYYTALSSSHFSSIYKNARHWLAKNIDESQKPLIFKENSQKKKYFGARYCPSKEHLKDVVVILLDKLHDEKSKLNNNFQSLINYHNQYTATCIYMQGFFSGIRAIRDPFVSIDMILKEYGIAVFRDKDDGSESHTRNIPVHSALIEIAKSYRNHRKSILSRCVLRGIDGAAELLRSETSETFLILGDKIIETKPSTLSQFLKDATPLPLNSNRKYLRTEMLEKGISSQAVDMLLGHANRGESIGHQFSCEIYSDLSKNVIEGMNIVLKPIGIIDAVNKLKGLSF